MEKKLIGQEKGQEQVSTSDYLKTIRRIFIVRLPLIIALIVICALAALITSHLMKPVYQASTTLRIQKQSGFLGGDNTVVMSKESLEAEAMWLKSSAILSTVMNQLGIGAEAKSQKEFLKVQQRLRKNITVETIENSDVLEITVRWDNPVLVKEIADTISDVFIEKYTMFSQGKARETTNFIKDQLEIVKLRLEDAQEKVKQFQKTENTLSMDQKISSLNSQLTSLEVKKAETDTEVDLERIKINELQETLDISDEDIERFKKNYSSFSPDNITTNDLIKNLRMQIAAIESEIVSLSSLYTDEYPALVQKRKELRSAKDKLNQTLCALVGEDDINIADKDPAYQDQLLDLVNRLITVENLEKQSKALDKLIIQMNARIKRMPDKNVEYMNMLREANVNEQLYNLLLTRLQEAEIRERANEWDIRVWDRAVEPLVPIKPKPVANTVFGAILGLLMGIGVSMTMEYFDDSFRDVSDVESYLNLPVLAAIPKFKNRPKNIKRQRH
jgi:uncharacterized protein involved in exopolysaccharide biosynthesis